MGLVYAEIELINAIDLGNARLDRITEDEVERIRVNMLVDSGSMYMCINEDVREQLQLSVVEKRKGILADGSLTEYDVAGPIEVRFKNRRCVVDAIVLPGNNELLLGVIPMEDMDVLIDPVRRELIVNPEHPDGAVMVMK